MVTGDGRMDSPGQCAQYCTYTVMENPTKKILSCITLDKRAAGWKSRNQEKLSFMKSMTALRDKNVDIVEVVTDAHMQISWSFWSFEISEDILRNQKSIVGKD